MLASKGFGCNLNNAEYCVSHADPDSKRQMRRAIQNACYCNDVSILSRVVQRYGLQVASSRQPFASTLLSSPFWGAPEKSANGDEAWRVLKESVYH